MKLKKTGQRLLCLLCAAVLAGVSGCAAIGDGLLEGILAVETVQPSGAVGEKPSKSEEPSESEGPLPYDRDNPYPWVAPTDYESDLDRRAAEIADGAIGLACSVVMTYPVTVIDVPVTPFWRGRRETIREHSQEWYDFLYEKASNFEDYALVEAELDTYKQDIFDTGNSFCSFMIDAVEALLDDYPELQVYYTNEFGPVHRPQYFLQRGYSEEPDGDVEKAKEEFALLEAVADRIVRLMPEGLSLYDKYRYLCIVVDGLCEYDYVKMTKTGTSDSVYSALILGTGVCRDYASAYRYLCAKADLWCENVVGTVGGEAEEDQIGHSWVAVKLGDEIYYIDPTWQDPLDPYSYGWHDFTFMFTMDQAEEDGRYTVGWTLGDFTRESVSNVELIPARERYEQWPAGRKNGG